MLGEKVKDFRENQSLCTPFVNGVFLGLEELGVPPSSEELKSSLLYDTIAGTLDRLNLPGSTADSMSVNRNFDIGLAIPLEIYNAPDLSNSTQGVNETILRSIACYRMLFEEGGRTNVSDIDFVSAFLLGVSKVLSEEEELRDD